MAKFDILLVGQRGRVGYEALLFAASLRDQDPGFQGSLVVAEPQVGGAWDEDVRLTPDVRAGLDRLGADIRPFSAELFGRRYPHGNKIEALSVLDPGPFVFFDSDTLVTGSLSETTFDFARPTASMRREGTWPEIELYGPGYSAIWGALYRRFGLDFETSLDEGQPDEHWERYLYFNAGWFLGDDGPGFGKLWADMAVSVRDDPPPELVCQSLDPWLDQVTLPLAIHAHGGGRPGLDAQRLDHDITCHWRALPLLFARESDHVVDVLRSVTAKPWLKKILKEYESFKRYLYQAKGDKARALFDRDNLPRPEAKIRKRLKNRNLWMR